jgi:hypothetical protein
MLTFVDKLSRKCWVYPTRCRSDIDAIFQLWRAYVERQSGQTLLALRMDNAKEYEALTKVFKADGIEAEFQQFTPRNRMRWQSD